MASPFGSFSARPLSDLALPAVPAEPAEPVDADEARRIREDAECIISAVVDGGAADYEEQR